MEDPYNKLAAVLEPQAVTTARASEEQDLQLLSITSAAVSLKRIADQLDGTAKGTTILDFIRAIANEAVQ